MKKAIIVAIAVILVMCFAGCESMNSAMSDLFVDKGSVELGQYSGIEVNSADYETEVTDEDVDAYINSMIQNSYTGTEVTDRPVQSGDTVNIDYVGYLDGVAFDGGTAVGADLVIGSGSYIDGFEDGLIGAEKGETRSLDLVFPENYGNEELAGKAVVFEVTVNTITDNTIPELTDELANTYFGTETAEELRNSVKEILASSNETTNQNQLSQDLWAQVVDSTTVNSYDNTLIELYTNYLMGKYEESAADNGMDLETLMESQYGITLEELESYISEYAQTAAKEVMTAKAITEKEGISLTDVEYAEGVEYYLAVNGYSNDDDFKADYGVGIEEYYGEDILRNTLTINKAVEFVTNNAVMK